jgi:hypothetical protein
LGSVSTANDELEKSLIHKIQLTNSSHSYIIDPHLILHRVRGIPSNPH